MFFNGFSFADKAPPVQQSTVPQAVQPSISQAVPPQQHNVTSAQGVHKLGTQQVPYTPPVNPALVFNLNSNNPLASEGSPSQIQLLQGQDGKIQGSNSTGPMITSSPSPVAPLPAGNGDTVMGDKPAGWKTIQVIGPGKTFEDFFFVGSTLTICSQNPNSTRPVLKEVGIYSYI